MASKKRPSLANAERFIVVDTSDPGIPEDERYECYEHSALLDTQEHRVVGTDGGEPEDQTFGRNWRWVPKELNALATRNADITEQIRRVIAGLEVALVEPHRARSIVEDLHDECVRVYNGEAPRELEAADD